MNRLRSALWLPIFDELADPAWSPGWPPRPRRRAGTACSSGTTCTGGHPCARWPTRGSRSPRSAAVTERLRLGPMVTPLARRRPAKVARETVTLDRLSGGRLTLGVGLGSDRFGSEFSGTGEEFDDRRRGGMLDEALDVLAAAWSGEPVQHHGRHYVVDGMSFLPRPFSAPDPGVGRRVPGTVRPLRRARGTTVSSRSTWSTRTSSPRSSPRSPSCADATGPYDIAVALPTAPTGALRGGRRDLVAGGVPAGDGVGGRGPRRPPGRAGLMPELFDYDAELRLHNEHLPRRCPVGARRPGARHRLWHRPVHA